VGHSAQPTDHPHIKHANLGTTSIYLQGIDTEEIIAAVHTRRAPVMSATAGLSLRDTTINSGGATNAPPLIRNQPRHAIRPQFVRSDGPCVGLLLAGSGRSLRQLADYPRPALPRL
jgi:hypothetical protein